MKSLLAKKAIFERLFEFAPDPIIIVSQQGKIVLANSEAERKFGYSLKEIVNMPLEILIPERFRKEHEAYRSKYNYTPRMRPMGSGLDLYARRRDGEEFPVEVSLSPLKIDDELLVIGLIRDISERKKAETSIKEKAKALEFANEELSRSNRELEQFAYIASHDLQEPLRSVTAACQLLERRFSGKLDATADEFLKYAVDGAKRMQDLIQDLLAYSRVGTKTRNETSFDMQPLIDQVIEALRASIDEAHAKITVDPMPTVAGDRSQIFQLLQNLLANAMKFRSERPLTIHIGVESRDEHYEFSVRDNGIGIESKYFDHIFEIFRRLHNNQSYPGTGIGLATCKKIVERHGGLIWVESELKKGSTFHFTLPKHERSE